MQLLEHVSSGHRPWNKGRLTGQKPPLKLNEVWAIRVRLQKLQLLEIELGERPPYFIFGLVERAMFPTMTRINACLCHTGHTQHEACKAIQHQEIVITFSFLNSSNTRKTSLMISVSFSGKLSTSTINISPTLNCLLLSCHMSSEDSFNFNVCCRSGLVRR